MKPIFRMCTLCTVLLQCTILPANAAMSEPMQNGFDDCRIANDDELNQMRGGFEIIAGSSHVLLSLGFQQVTFINGILAAMTTFNLPQTSSDVSMPSQQNRKLTQIVQNGPGNTFVPPSSFPSGGTTLIQNSLNNQLISNMTIVNATISSKAFLNSMTISATLHQAASLSLR